jgi:CheY-like chemotaxis protein/HPt (histidine-containing phosphotransfer) domain-containing protein
VIDAEGAGQIIGDSFRLREILINLVDNAVKFTERGEVIITVTKLSETRDGVVLRFAVKDTGVGISQAEQERLFKPFSQVDESTTRRFGGSGLGLVICRRLVEKMGGEIGFESEVGKGSTFWFEVPFERRPGVAEPGPALQGQRVLVVDDNPAVCECLRRSVASWGMRPDSAPGAHEAQRSLWRATEDDDPYGFVIIDTNMPGTDGLSLARQIKADPDIGPARLVLLASVDSPLDDETLAEVGGDACIQKPVMPSRLHACLADSSNREVPASDQSPTPPAFKTAAAPELTAGAQGARILLAEDNPLNREMLLDMLHTLGYRAHAVEDGTAVRPAIEASAYDLVLLDCQMPGKDGYQVAREIRDSEPEDQHMAVVAITASAAESGARARCLAAGMDDYISKPVRLDKLAAVLDGWLPAVAARGTGETAGSIDDESEARAALDPGVWDEIRGTGGADRAAHVEKYADLFVEDAKRRLRAMEASLHGDQADRFAREAHALKAGCLQIGARRMAEICEMLQQAARAGSLDGTGASLDRLKDEFRRAKEALAAERAKVS